VGCERLRAEVRRWWSTGRPAIASAAGALRAAARIARDLLGWQPTGAGLIADLKEGHYFA
jgi:hypothetical protein